MQLSSRAEAMDWHSWLSKSSLCPGLVRELSLLFSANELEREDIAHLNHESLQSMGISIAKHRIEILKLAQQEKKPGSPRRTAARRLLAAAMRVAEHLRSLVRPDTSAIVVVPRPAPSGRGSAMLRRNRQGKAAQLTDGGEKAPASPAAGLSSASRVVYGREEMRWVSMFQDLKPT